MSRRIAIDRTAIVGLAIPVIALCTWPIPTLMPTAGLDASWQAALHVAVRQDLDFGTDVLFTYGPLGFLGQPRLFSTLTGVLSVLFTAAVHLCWCALLVLLASRRLPLSLAVGVAYAIAAVGLEPAEIASLGIFGFVLATLGVRRQLPVAAIAALGGIAGILFLVKTNSGLAAGALGVMIPLARREAAGRGVAAFAAGAAAAVTVGWAATTNAPTAIVPFVLRSLGLVAGFTDAMALEETQRQWEYVAAAFLILGLVGAAVLLADLRAGRQRLLLIVSFLFGSWLLFKRGFTRHDAHSVPFFLGCAMVPLAVRWRPGVAGRVASVALVAAGLTAALAAYDIPLRAHYSPVRHLRLAVDQARTLASSDERTSTMAAARAAIIDDLAVDEGTAAEMRRGTAHVDPFELSLVWALELTWRPAPVFQSYQANTDALDDLNAALLSSERAPDRILRPLNRGAVDGRNPDFESPAYMAAMFCHYREVSATARWQVVQRVPDRCGRPRRIGRAKAGDGEIVKVPSGAPDEIVFAHVHFEEDLLERLQSLAFKRPGAPQVVLDGRQYRLVAATAVNPLLLRVPPSLGYAAGFGGSAVETPATTISVVGGGPIELEFFAQPLSP